MEFLHNLVVRLVIFGVTAIVTLPLILILGSLPEAIRDYMALRCPECKRLALKMVKGNPKGN